MHKIIKFIVPILTAGFMIVPVNAESNYDLLDAQCMTTKQLEYALRGEIKDYAKAFVRCEKEYGVNAVVLSSIAALESGWGKSELAQSKNNIFGWKQKDGKYKSFDNVDECIEHVAKTISEQYLDDNGYYYNSGTKVSDISEYYSASDDWTDEICNIANQIEERCEEYEETAPEFRCRG